MRIFVQNIPDNELFRITGEDASHVTRSLRMRIGDELTVCDCAGNDYLCEITDYETDTLYLKRLSSKASATEPSLHVSLYQSLPKGDKLDTIIQKSVELGITEIIPFFSARSIVRPDPKKQSEKTIRRNKIALEAAKQSERGIIPTVAEPISYSELLKRILGTRTLFFYELGGLPINKALSENESDINIIIGPEGGFEHSEAVSAQENGAILTTLGPRILRTETAPIAALAAIMCLTGNLN